MNKNFGFAILSNGKVITIVSTLERARKLLSFVNHKRPEIFSCSWTDACDCINLLKKQPLEPDTTFIVI